MDIEKPLEIELIPQQAEFLTSEKRFPCFCAGIGTGKTYMLLLKAVRFCQTYPGSLGMIVRRQFTDLHDSTINDFRRYFKMDIDTHKEVVFENGSKLMFRHGAEIAVLKNVTLDFVGIEQAEEFEDDTQFNYLRDRIRGKAAPYQQMFLIANANGHNWIWRKWFYENPSEDYHGIKATTFDNARNLPEAFINDQRAREKEEPRHFRRMVMNDFSEDLADDNVFTSSNILKSSELNFITPPFVRYAAGLDVGRFGTDATCLQIIAQVGTKKWKHVFQEEKKGWDAPKIVGWVKDMWKTFPFDTLGVDDIGVGGGCKDYLNDSSLFTTYGFIANEKPNGESVYPNKKSEAMFKLEEYISKEWIQLLNDIYLHEEFMTVKYFYRGESIKHIVSKDQLRSKGIKSYNKVDALMIALYYADEKDGFDPDDIMVPGVYPSKKNFQNYAITDLPPQ